MTTTVGIVGAGYIARVHAERLMRQEDVDVVAVADPSRERASALATSVGAAACADASSLLDAHRPDALFICVPPFAHGKPEAAALERGVPFFVEKPIALDLAGAEAVAGQVRAKRLVTAVGYHWRHADVVEGAANLLRGRQVRLVQGYWLSSTPGAPWWIRKDRSGGQILEQTTHVFDLIRLFVGEVIALQGSACVTSRPALPDADVADVSVVTLRFASGAIGVVTSTCLLGAARRVGLHLIGDGLSVELAARGPGGGPPLEISVDGAAGMETTTGRNDPFDAEQRDFLAAVRGESDATRVPYEEALRTHRLAFAAARSCDDGVAVELPGADA